MKIHKYELPSRPGRYTLSLPTHRIVLSCKNHLNKLYVWAAVDGDEMRDKVFIVAETGGEVPYIPGEQVRFLDTVLLFGGTYVLHVWEVL